MHDPAVPFRTQPYLRVNAERVLLLGGGAALLLQLAHPAVADGVARHSDFVAHPLRRLYATITAMQRLVFGDDTVAGATADRLRRLHARVRGQVGGAGYAANDPQLQLWVHATLVQTALDTYSYFVAPLGGEERGRYFAGAATTALRLGLPAAIVPATEAAFASYWQSMLSHAVDVGDSARRVATAVLRPPLPGLPPVAGRWLGCVTARLLPAAISTAYCLPSGSTECRTAGRLRRIVSSVLPRLPAAIRLFPLARRHPQRGA